MDVLFTGLLPEYDGFFLFLLLAIPAVILILLAWQVETAVKSAYYNETLGRGRFITSYKTHPREWELVHRISVNLAFFLISQWFLFVYGFVSALTAYLALVAYGRGNKPLSETAKLASLDNRVEDRSHDD